MKKNGFIMSTYVYMLLVFFLLLLASILVVLNNTKLLSSKIKNQGERLNGKYGYDFEIIGGDETYSFLGDEYVDEGFSIVGTDGTNLSQYVKTTSNVNINKIGTYKVTYTVTYSKRVNTFTRTVYIVNRVMEITQKDRVQDFIVPMDGYYKIELWGAKGGVEVGARGGYTSGIIYLEKTRKGTEPVISINVGALSATSSNGTNFNGGTSNSGGYNGGGATDVRYNGSFLTARIMVAAGGGSGTGSAVPGAGGGLVGMEASVSGSGAGTQISVGAKANSAYTDSSFGVANGGCSGGNGYYPGGAGACANGSSGGSSFISGYAGVNAITSNSSLTPTGNTRHYSGKYFINGYTEAGINDGAGKARITFISKEKPERVNTRLNGVRYIKDCVNGSTGNNYNHWTELQAIKDGLNIAKGKTVTASTTTSADLSKIVDGDITKDQYASVGSNKQCVTVDLGDTYDLDEIAVWHYYGPNRHYYDNNTYVSSNNTNWTLVMNSVAYETSSGKHVSAYEPSETMYESITRNNIISNNNFTTFTTSTVGWDTQLNGEVAITPTGFSNGYSASRPNPSEGYHAHFDNTKFGYNVMVFPNLNSVIGQKHRWLGIYYSIPADTLEANTKYQVSMEINTDTIGMKFRNAIYYPNRASNQLVYNTYYTTEKELNKWATHKYEFTTSSTASDLTNMRLYFYGHGTGNDPEGTIYIKNVYLTKVTT